MSGVDALDVDALVLCKHVAVASQSVELQVALSTAHHLCCEIFLAEISVRRVQLYSPTCVPAHSFWCCEEAQ